MRKSATALVDLASGIPFVLIGFLGARVLLQSRSLVFLCFPLLCTIALAVGFWRGRVSSLPLFAVAALTNTPLLLLTAEFFSGRSKPFIVFPILTMTFVVAGVVIARSGARPLVLAIVVISTTIAAVPAGPAFVRFIARRQEVNEEPVQFTIHLVDGKTITSRQLRGSVVVLDFWATWCVPCQHELPVIERVYTKMKNRNHVAFFAIDGVMTDSPGDANDTAEKAASFFRHGGGYTIPLVWDGGGTLEKSFSVAGFPTLLVLDANGRVRMRHIGFVGSEDLEGDLSRKIDELRGEVDTKRRD